MITSVMIRSKASDLATSLKRSAATQNKPKKVKKSAKKPRVQDTVREELLIGDAFVDGSESSDRNLVGAILSASERASLDVAKEEEVGGLFDPKKDLMIFTCRYDGLIRLMDVEDGTFNIIHSGELKLQAERTRRVSNSWDLHDKRINTIDFNPENPNMMATRIWDLRLMKKHQPDSFKTVQHQSSVHSIFLTWWTPTRYNKGNMKRAINIISADSKTTMSLFSEYMTSIGCRLATHPQTLGKLASATAHGKVFYWTSHKNMMEEEEENGAAQDEAEIKVVLQW
ncbi:hypothetical protein ZIOFF_043055 [Zingiber officinale]|uniref:Uncharacterized protein n=1 Tax=Zingiber officinale TaxID=94328 RepID=A0A8J5FVV8_ZINOF|nr:hypothetical protein ZIOFF_043055 [Zingiber officinale]